jgi:hypothetical protein
MIKRRDFIAGLGSAVAWPLAARVQQGDRVRRIGVLTSYDENDPAWKTGLLAFTQSLADLAWTDGRDVRVDLRGAGFDTNRMRALAQELVGLQPASRALVLRLVTLNASTLGEIEAAFEIVSEQRIAGRPAIIPRYCWAC